MTQSTPSIYALNGSRKYLTNNERQRFIDALNILPHHEQLFCLTLLYTGCRISEALKLQASNVAAEESFIVIRSLKKRNKVAMRCIPAPQSHLEALTKLTPSEDVRLFPWGRTYAWMVIKRVMTEAGITGIKATPRGLRHTYGVRGVMHDIALDRMQKWLGHTDINTTAIYTNIVGKEERDLAARMW